MAAEAPRYSREGEWVRSPEIYRPRVVVTGIGMVTPLGNDVETTWKRLKAGENGLVALDMAEVAEKAHTPRLSNMTHEVNVVGITNINTQEEVAKLLTPDYMKVVRREWRDYSYSAELALLVSLQAARAAGILGDEGVADFIDNSRFGVKMGTMIGGLGYLPNVYQKILDRDPTNAVKPSDTFISDPARVASVPSMVLGARGPVDMISAACASGSIAIISAGNEIVLGNADIMIAGGVDAPIEPGEIELFTVVRALTTEKDPDKASRPFDKAHSGFVMAEGACALILESEAHARKRGAKILAVLAGYSQASDAYHKSSPSGYAARKTLRDTLIAAGVPNPDEGGIYDNTHGTSTQTGDGVELIALKEVIGELPFEVDLRANSSKSMVGHTMGASGAVEAGVAILSLNEGLVHPTRNLENPIPEAEGMNLVPHEALEMKIGLSLSGNFGFGGPGTTVGFKKPE